MNDTAAKCLGSLLAIIHRDGGHYQTEHGTAESTAAACAIVHTLRAEVENLTRQRDSDRAVVCQECHQRIEKMDRVRYLIRVSAASCERMES